MTQSLTALHPALARSPARLSRAPLVIALAFLALHIMLAATVDVADPEAFLRADRAPERFEVIRGLLALEEDREVLTYLSAHGVIGDYAIHGALEAIGGRFAVILTQVALAILSSLAVHRLGTLIGLNGAQAAIAMVAYLSLPHTLVFPHQLSSEALHVPLLVISTWLFAEGLVQRRAGMLIMSALCLGAATLIRPITLLWPVAGTIVLIISRRPREGVLYGCVAYLPVLVWMLFVVAQTGSIGLGESSHSMGRNLYNRVARITATMPREARDAARAEHLPQEQKTLGPVGYLSFAVEHPLPVAKHTLRDASAFFAKSGVERITLDYLSLTSGAEAVQDQQQGWRRRLELYGPLDTLAYLWAQLGPVLLTSIVGAIAMVMIVALAIVGTMRYLRDWRAMRTPAALLGATLAALIVYTFVFSQVLNAMQSRQRAPAEFALVLLAVAGAAALRRRRGLRREAALRPQA